MVRYPYWLEYLFEADAMQLSDGSFERNVSEWRRAGCCNAVQNTSARTFIAKNGKARAYSYEITRPAGACPIPEGTPVRVLDRRGKNIFAPPHNPERILRDADGKALRDAEGYVLLVLGDDSAINNASYPVVGNDTRNQRYAKTRLWV